MPDKAHTDGNTIRVKGIDIRWDIEKGTCTFENLPVAMMWVNTTLAGLMAGLQNMVGAKRFALALQSEGRKSVEADWQVIENFSNFRDGFKAIADIAAVAGWGAWELTSMDTSKKECRFRVKESWEGNYQNALGVSWGSGMVAGKFAGYCSRLFGTNCWAEQTAAIAKGDAFDEFVVKPSQRSIEKEIGSLLASDEATRADMAVALQNLEREIAERKRAETALRESEEKFRSIAEQSPNMIFINRKGRIVYANHRCEEIMGYTREEFYAEGFDFLDLIAPESLELIRSAFTKHLKGMEVVPYEYTLVSKRGEKIEAIISTKLMTYQGDMAICGIVTDITARKRAETALRESERRYRILFESAGDGIYVHDLDGNILDANQMQCERLGYSREEYLKLNLRDIVESETAELFPERVRQLKKDGHIVLESVHIKKGGAKLPIETNSSLFEYKGRPAILAIIRDISERKSGEEERMKLEAQLQEAQKMEAIGTLAGGIAHDFNNLLMGIQGNASLLPFDLDPDHGKYEKAIDKIRNIEHIVQSGGDLTRQLLGFASGGKYEAKPTDLNDLLKKSAQLFGRTKKELAIHSRYQEGLWTAEVDRGQIEQVLLNLFVNAWQAMPDGRGEIYLETENVFLEEAYTGTFGRDEGHYVRISVTDTGEGMDRQTREKIFDPFFTTKDMGRGTGLGLASAYGIIKNHGGIIKAYSEKGHGTTFNIYLPTSSKTVLGERENSEALLTFSGTALLVDDEAMIIDVGKKILKQLGFEVMTAGGGEEALRIFMENRYIIDIVILDLIMPGTGGGVIYDRLKEMNPDVKVLLSSGYSINGEASGILARGCDGFIQKPFDMKGLSKKIGEIMGSHSDL